jgi:hypothetical protein
MHAFKHHEAIFGEFPATRLPWRWRCGIGSWGGRCPSLADYVAATGTKRGATAAGGCLVLAILWALREGESRLLCSSGDLISIFAGRRGGAVS